MTRFLFALAVLLLMGAHESIVAALGASVVGFSLPPLAVFALVALSPFLMLLANGLPSLVSFLPDTPTTTAAPIVNVTSSSPIDAEALAAAFVASQRLSASLARASAPLPAVDPVAPPAPVVV